MERPLPEWRRRARWVMWLQAQRGAVAECASNPDPLGFCMHPGAAGVCLLRRLECVAVDCWWSNAPPQQLDGAWRFGSRPGAPELFRADLVGFDNGIGCVPDQRIDIVFDVTTAIDAFRGLTYEIATGCPVPCD